MEDDLENGAAEEDSGGSSLTKKVATGAALGVATAAVAAGARKLMSDTGEKSDETTSKVGEVAASARRTVSKRSPAKRSTAKRSSAKRASAKRSATKRSA